MLTLLVVGGIMRFPLLLTLLIVGTLTLLVVGALTLSVLLALLP